MSHAPAQAPSAAFPIGAEPSWRPDPVNRKIERWWDGTHWTDRTQDSPHAGFDPALQSRQAVKAALRSRQEARPSRAIAVATQATLGMTALTSAVAMVGLGFSYNTVSTRIATGTGNESLWAGASRTLGNALSVYSVPLALGAVLTAVWFVVRTKDRRVNPVLIRRSATASIVSIFVPIIQLWWPAQGMKDLWHAARPELAFSGFKERLPVPASIFVWWASLVASNVVPVALTAITVAQVDLHLPLPTLSQIDLNTVGEQQTALALLTLAMAISFGLVLLSTLALIVVIGQIERHLALPFQTAGQEFKVLADG